VDIELSQLHPQRPPHRRRSAPECRQRHRGICGIKQPIQLSSIRLHPRCHCGFSEALRFHCFTILGGDDFLDRVFLTQSEQI
jgi:hypothetical protein